MKKNKFILLAIFLVLLSMLATACSIKTETSESYTDADGNTVTTTTTNDNGKVTTETTTSSSNEEEIEELEEDEVNDESSEEVNEEANASTGIPDDVAWFVESLREFVTKYEMGVPINDPVDTGDGKYAIPTNTDQITFVSVTDSSNALSYAITVMGNDDELIQGFYKVLLGVLFPVESELEAAYEAIARGETPVATEGYTLTATTGEINDQTFSTLVATVN